jgi:hypothetical protein
VEARDIPGAQTVSLSFTAYGPNVKLTAVRNTEEIIKCITLKQYFTGQSNMQKWQQDKGQLLVFTAKYCVNQNVQV